MVSVLLLHYREAQTGRQIAKDLKAAGHRIAEAVPEHPEFESTLEVADPDVLVVECSQGWNKGLEAAGHITGKQAYRDLPVLLVGLPEAGAGFKRLKVPEALEIGPEGIVEAVAKVAG